MSKEDKKVNVHLKKKTIPPDEPDEPFHIPTPFLKPGDVDEVIIPKTADVDSGDGNSVPAPIEPDK